MWVEADGVIIEAAVIKRVFVSNIGCDCCSYGYYCKDGWVVSFACDDVQNPRNGSTRYFTEDEALEAARNIVAKLGGNIIST